MNWQINNRSLYVGSFLLLLGGSLNQFLTIPLYANLILHLGTVTSVVCLYLLGYRWAIFHTILIGIPLGFSMDSWFIPVLVVVEILVIGIGVKRHWSVVYADLLFWLFVGMPLTFLAFQWLNPDAVGFAVSTVLKQAVNGLLYVSLAALILPFIPSSWLAGVHSDSLPKMRQVIQTKLVTVIIGFSILVGVVASEQSVRQLESNLGKNLTWQAQQAAFYTQDTIAQHKQVVQDLSSLMSIIGLTTEQTKQTLQLFQRGNQGFISMLIADSNANIAMAAPPSFDKLLQSDGMTLNVGDRDYFKEAFFKQKLFLSQVFLGRGFGNDVIVAISAPIYSADQTLSPIGIVEGSLNLVTLKGIDKKIALDKNASILMVDSNNRIIYASERLKLEALSPLALDSTEENYRTNIPIGKFALSSKSQTLFYQNYRLENGWKAYVLQSPSVLISELEKYYMLILSIAIIIAFISYFISRHIASVIARPIELISSMFARSESVDSLKWKTRSDFTAEAEKLFDSLVKSRNLQLSFQHQLEEKVLIQTEQLQETNQSLKKATEDAQESNRLKGEFLANMSHEIRTPMNGVLGMLRLLEKGDLNQVQSHQLNLAVSSAESLLGVINDVLDLSKIEAGKLELESTEFSLSRLFERVVEAFSLEAHTNNIELVLELHNLGTDVLVGDPTRLRQVLTNLLSNAFKFTSQGYIKVCTAFEEVEALNQVKLTVNVRDTGIGIPEDKIDLLFEAFRQVDASTTREFGGTGLGLSISKQICELMQGTISVTSTLGEGSDFEFQVLLSHSQSSQSIDYHLSNSKVLLVDKESVSSSAIEKQLNHWGADVRFLTHGKDVVEYCTEIEKQNVNEKLFLIINYQLADMSGIELISYLKSKSDSRYSVIILKPMIEEKQSSKKFLESNHVALTKPVTLHKLIEALESVDGKASSKTADVYQSATKDNSILVESLSTYTLLVVEDNHVNQEVIGGILTELGISFQLAVNGEEAIAFLRTSPEKYSLVLMDCQMPVIDGYKATELIRKGEAGKYAKNIPIVAMTAHAMQGDREKCLRVGMDGYLAKPIEVDELISVVSEQLNLHPENLSKKMAMDIFEHSISESVDGTESIWDKSVWDKSSALRRVLGKKDILYKAINIFTSEVPEALDKINNAIGLKDYSEIASLAHTIKGASANLSALRLSETAQLLEASSQRKLNSDVVKLFSELKREYAELKKALLQFCIDFDENKRNTTKSIKLTESMEPEKLKVKVKQLLQKVEQNAFVPGEEVDEIKLMLSSTDSQALGEELVELMNKFDYVNALKCLKKIEREVFV